MTPDVERLQERLSHQFKNAALLERALTHKSRAYEQNLQSVIGDNEQLEFLGDSILGFMISEWLITEHPDFPEGRLSKLKAHLVSSAHLYEAAQRLSLGDFLLLGRGEEMSGGRQKRALLANAVEALIAALYLDGGVDAARRFVVEHVVAGFTMPADGSDRVLDYKSALQEMTQALKLPAPRYSILEERGPEHAKTFIVEVRVGREWTSRAEGLSKKSAGQQAARQVLQQLIEWGR